MSLIFSILDVLQPKYGTILTDMVPIRKASHRAFYLSLLVLALALSLNLSAQENQGIQSGDSIQASSFVTENLFSGPIPRAQTSARVGAWNPDTRSGLIAVKYVYPEGYHQIDDDDFFTLKPQEAQGIIFGSTLKGEPVLKDGLAEYFDETTLLLEFHAAANARKTKLSINALFQICDDEGICLFPDSELVEVDFDPSAALLDAGHDVRAVLEWAAREPGGEDEQLLMASAQQPIAFPTATSGRSLLLFFLMAFVGGVLLNLMPCVLPLLSVKALGLVKQAKGEHKAIFIHSWLYVVGILTTFWILALVVVILQSSGKLIGWGFQFQSPYFVLALIAIIWVFALSMFNLFIIEAPQRSLQSASMARKREGYPGSFLTGIFAVLVATPCTAPLLGPALGFAFSQPPLIIFTMFSLIGLGLGFPFLLLGFWPSIINKLPKPGSWMNVFKEVMGFLLLGTVVYLLTTFARLAPGTLNAALWWLLFLGFAAWLLGKARDPSSRVWFRRTGQIASLIIALGSGFLLIDLWKPGVSTMSAATASLSINRAIEFDQSDFDRRIADNEPVFLEFTAAWCTTCKVNQRVINHRDIRALMERNNIAHIKVDLTSYDEEKLRVLAEFGRVGVPLYVFYRPGAEPYLFPELLSVDGLKKVMEKIES